MNNRHIYHGTQSVKAELLGFRDMKRTFTLSRIEGYPRFHDDYISWNIFTRNPDDPLRVQIEQGVKKYNAVVDLMNSTPGFIDYFRKHDLIVPKAQIEKDWGKDFTDAVFQLEEYEFIQEIHNINGSLYAAMGRPVYCLQLDATTIQFQKNEDGIVFRVLSNDITDKNVFWNMTDTELDLTFYLWEYFDVYTDIQVDSSYIGYDVYEQSRDIIDPDPRLVKAMQLLEEAGYLRTYSVELGAYAPCDTYVKSDGTVDVGVLSLKWEGDHELKPILKTVLEYRDQSE